MAILTASKHWCEYCQRDKPLAEPVHCTYTNCHIMTVHPEEHAKYVHPAEYAKRRAAANAHVEADFLRSSAARPARLLYPHEETA